MSSKTPPPKRLLSPVEEATLRLVANGETDPRQLKTAPLMRLIGLRMVLGNAGRVAPTSVGLDWLNENPPQRKGK